MTAPDFGKTAGDYAKHRAGFPPRFFDEIRARNIGLPGQRALDLGTGTGTVARGLALGGAKVTGLDPSEPLLEQARALDRETGVSIDYVVAKAEDTGLPGPSFDVVTAGQCWHWFNRPRAAAEAMRLLRPGGALVIAHFDWIPLRGNVVHATEELIQQHNPDWKLAGGTGIYARWLEDAALTGFSDLETFSFDLDVPYSHEAWRGRIRASAGVAASLPQPAVDAFDRDLAALLASRFPEDPLAVHHRTWALVCRKPG